MKLFSFFFGDPREEKKITKEERAFSNKNNKQLFDLLIDFDLPSYSKIKDDEKSDNLLKGAYDNFFQKVSNVYKNNMTEKFILVSVDAEYDQKTLGLTRRGLKKYDCFLLKLGLEKEEVMDAIKSGKLSEKIKTVVEVVELLESQRKKTISYNKDCNN